MSRHPDSYYRPPTPPREPHFNDGQLWIAAAGVVLVLAVVLVLTVGCASAPPCVPEVITVPSPPEVVTVLPPMPRIPAAPDVLSTTPEGLALVQADPAAWLRLLAADLLRAHEAYRAAADELEALADAAWAAETGDPR